MADEYADLEAAIKSRISAGFSGIAKIAWPGVDVAVGNATQAMQVDIETGRAESNGLGAAAGYRITGQVKLMLFAKKAAAQVGSNEQAGYLDDLAALFPRGQTVAVGSNHLLFFLPFVTPGPDTEEWFGRTLVCPFRMDT